jgi:lytic cellulose monooxygenase (C1-hydroxylating)
MGHMESPNMKPTEVKFFKIDQGTYDPKSGIWGSDVLIKNNNSWTVQTPSDIKPGKYIVRHELIALHFGGSGNPEGAGTASSGAQLYPVCINVNVIGEGTQTPEGAKFPGAYSPKDPGILDNIYYGPNRYVS